MMRATRTIALPPRSTSSASRSAGLNVLQTQRQLFYDGWLLRLSPGMAKRGRSVNPHFGSSLPLDAQDRLLRERLRAARAADAVSDHAVEPAVRSRRGARRARLRGVRRDARAGGDARPPAGVARSRRRGRGRSARTRSRSSKPWASLRDSTPLQREAHRERLVNSPLGKRHAVVRAGGRVVCTAQVAVEDDLAGVFDVVTAADARAPRVRDARLRVAPVLGVAARRARRVSAGERRQRAGDRRRTGSSASRPSTPITTAADPGSANEAAAHERLTFDLAVALGARCSTRGMDASPPPSRAPAVSSPARSPTSPGARTGSIAGFVTYSNEAKIEMLGVRAETLAAHGAVSEATAREMAAGALGAKRRRHRGRRSPASPVRPGARRRSRSGWSASRGRDAAAPSSPAPSVSRAIAPPCARRRSTGHWTV